MEGFGPALTFWTLAVLTAISGAGVLLSRNLFHAVLFLIVSFVCVAGFFVLLSADFLAMAQVIIYVGAIAVLMLFAANPFGLHDFYDDESRNGSHQLADGDSLTFRYRVLIHSGQANPELIEAEFRDFSEKQ